MLAVMAAGAYSWFVRAAGAIERVDVHTAGHSFVRHRHDTYATGVTLDGVQSVKYMLAAWHHESSLRRTKLARRPRAGGTRPRLVSERCYRGRWPDHERASSEIRTCWPASGHSELQRCEIASQWAGQDLDSEPGMRPRPVLPRQFYMITRRCTQRQLLLRPDPETNNTFTYCLIEAALRFGIEVLLPCAMSRLSGARHSLD
jgi:hypothetical protein